MKLQLLDTYHIRVRLSASIIVLAPLAITIFLCFQEIATLASSTVLIAVLLAFTNYLPIVQRQIYQKNLPFKKESRGRNPYAKAGKHAGGAAKFCGAAYDHVYSPR